MWCGLFLFLGFWKRRGVSCLLLEKGWGEGLVPTAAVGVGSRSMERKRRTAQASDKSIRDSRFEDRGSWCTSAGRGLVNRGWGGCIAGNEALSRTAMAFEPEGVPSGEADRPRVGDR